MEDYPHIFEPGNIGNLRVRNRLIVTAMVTQYCTTDGMPTERYIRYHERKARGGWGLVITEDYAVMKSGRSFERVPGLWEDGQVPAHREFVRRVHEAGGTIAVQLYHAGRQACGNAPVAPSALREPSMPVQPTALTQAQIGEILEAFEKAARRAKECGFDAIELHGGHGYLINEFLSPYANKRTDGYGGSVRGRARFALEAIAAVKRGAGPDMPILFRLNVNDHVVGGITPQVAASYACLLEEAGVDLINCTQGMYTSKEFIIPPTATAPGAFIGDSRCVRNAVGVPISVVGRINDPDLAEQVLASGQSDFVSMARASLADPDFPLKAAEGAPERIIRCIGCCRGCTGQNARKEPICCILNPETGYEGSYDLSPTADSKRVLVIGGGISGAEAAICAARRGHEVTLVEASDHLGGQWALASVPPGKEELSSFAAWQAGEVKRLGVSVELGRQADKALVDRIAPDAVVVAVGSKTVCPPIQGLATEPSVHDAREVLAGKAELRGRVCVLGGGLVGAETALFLAEQGCQVTVVEMADEIARDCEPSPRKLLLGHLEERRVILMSSTKARSVSAEGVEVESADGRHLVAASGGVVNALGARPIGLDSSVLEGYQGKVITVGDANGAGDAFHGIREGFEAGLAV